MDSDAVSFPLTSLRWCAKVLSLGGERGRARRGCWSVGRTSPRCSRQNHLRDCDLIFTKPTSPNHD